MQFETVAEINLSHLKANIQAIRQKAAPAVPIAVVKADAYGHGAVPVSRCLADFGVTRFAVARFEEAMALRDSGISGFILVFGRLTPDQLPQAARAGLRVSVFGKQDLLWIEKAPVQAPIAVHVKMETGMGRVGLIWDQEPDFFDVLKGAAHCRLDGVYSHFSTSDDADKAYARIQISRFGSILSRLNGAGMAPPMAHMANSGAILDLPESYFHAVRPGVSLYGHYPSTETSASIPLRQVMTFKTHVSHVRTLPAGHPVSYCRRFVTPAETRIAVLPVGYADGYRRAFTNNAEVLIRGKRYPVVGTVTMDQTMVRIGDDPIHPGDPVILWGDGPQGSIQALEAATSIGTIPYELTCGVSRRVRRIYID